MNFFVLHSSHWLFLFYFLIYFIDYAITVVPFSSPHPLIPLHPAHSLLPAVPTFSSCPWVIHISSLAYIFPLLSLTSPCLFSTYHLCYLFPVPFSPLSPSYSPADNPHCDLHFCDSVPVLVVCLVVFFLGLIVNSCEFIVILLFIFLIFFLDKSL